MCRIWLEVVKVCNKSQATSSQIPAPLYYTIWWFRITPTPCRACNQKNFGLQSWPSRPGEPSSLVRNLYFSFWKSYIWNDFPEIFIIWAPYVKIYVQKIIMITINIYHKFFHGNCFCIQIIGFVPIYVVFG